MRRTAQIAICLVALSFVTSSEPLSYGQVFTDPTIVACGSPSQPIEIVPEIRQAASLAANKHRMSQVNLEFSSVFGEELFRTQFFLNPLSISLPELRSLEQLLKERIDELEAIGNGPNRECREIAGFTSFSNPVLKALLSRELNLEMSSPLSQLYLYHNITNALIVIRATSLDIGAGFRATFSAELLEQTQITAQSIEDSPSYEIAMAKASVVFLPMFLALSIADDEELTLTVLNPTLWESLACGDQVIVPGFNIELDGSLNTPSAGSAHYPLRQMGGELWAFTSTLLNIILILFNPSYGESYYEQAVNGCSQEIRFNAANLYFSLVPELTNDLESLQSMVMNGESDELKWVAASHLSSILADDLTLTEEYLQSIAIQSRSPMMRSAAGHALGLRWMKKVESGEIDYTSTFEYPSNGGINLVSGTLTQFALAHTNVHPELAQAAILPLFAAFNLVATNRP